MNKHLFALAFMGVAACHGYQPCGIDPNCGRHNFATTYTAPNGFPAHHVYCDGSDMCEHLNGQLCPSGYVFLSGETSHMTDDVIQCRLYPDGE